MLKVKLLGLNPSLLLLNICKGTFFMPPEWDCDNLLKHTKTRRNESLICDMPFGGENLENLTPSLLKKQSLATYKNVCIKFVAEYRIKKELDRIKHNNASYFPPRRYYVDKNLMVSIVGLDRNGNETNFVTCFHKHFYNSSCFRTRNTLSSGSRLIKFKNYIQNKLSRKDYQNFTRE